MSVLSAVFLVGTVVSWWYSLYHFLKAMPHRGPNLRWPRLFFRFWRAYDPSNYRPEGRTHVRRARLGFAVFAVAALVGGLQILGIDPGS